MNLSNYRILTGALALTVALVSGCGSSDDFVFTNQVQQDQPVSQVLPVASNDAFQALGNATLNQAAPGVLGNDTLNQGEISTFQTVGSQGGSVDLNADGSFTYTPVAGFVGAETFTYTLTNADGESTATVTLTSTGFGRFVDNSVAANGTGTQGSPFNNLQDAVNAAQSGDTVFVARGDGSSTGLSTNVTLPQGVNLIGEGQGLVLGQTIVPEGQQPVVNATIIVSGNNTISGIRFEGPATIDNDFGLSVRGDGAANVTITNNTFASHQVGMGYRQVALLNLTGLADIGNNQFLIGLNGRGADCRTETGTANILVNDNTVDVTGDGGEALVAFAVDIQGDTIATVECGRNEINGSQSGPSIKGWLDLGAGGTSQTTLMASLNTTSFLSDDALNVEANDQSRLTASFAQNLIDQSKSPSDPVAFLELNDSSQTTLVFDNNMITDAADTGIEISQSTSSVLNLAFRNNTVNTVDGALFVSSVDSTTFCGEIINNTFDAYISFDERTSGDFRVEQFGDPGGDLLEMINTFVNGEVDVDSGTVTSVPAGTCMIP